MSNRWAGGRTAAGMAAAVAMATLAPPVQAQDGAAEARVRKLEAEVRALQRKVFPNGDQATFNPQITRPATPSTQVGQPATSPITDLLARMDSLEAQMARVTAQSETNGNRIAQLEARVAAAAASQTAATATGETAAAVGPVQATPPGSAPAPGPAPAPALVAAPGPAPAANLEAMRRGAARDPVTPTSQRLAMVEAVEKPQSGDPAEDSYSYGFRLWGAKLYPEAEQQLKLFVQQYPGSPRISFGRNLLGRSYLDGGEPREAAKWFLQNYQADKTAPRAPDSLLYLAVTMKQLGDTARACIALGEFAQAYAADATGRLKPDYDAARKGLTCS